MCSVDPDRSRRAELNIRRSAGIDPEIFIHDNREGGWGRCETYNHYASRARNDCLCFLHEDSRSGPTRGPARSSIFTGLRRGAGVIGFFGYALKTRSPSLSGGLKRSVRASLYRHAGGRVVRTENRAGEADFSPVVQVDGQCLIVPKSVWREHPFDEELFRDFHLYDVDFCVRIARRYANYICHSVFGEHGSVGSYDDDRYRNVLLFQRRWDGCLPLTVVPTSPREVREAETFAAYKFYKRVLSEGRSAYVPFARSMYRRYRTGRADWRLLRHALHYALILCLRRLRHG
ncbi:glycosyltransferase [Alistipes ihumii]|uniref:glycosyltransferase n=1 Tax=Alistipes ihumii TaxID=1470347 RepID=UPI00249583D8|nr:glycosyltransferase [Alistipes ihumii]